MARLPLPVSAVLVAFFTAAAAAAPVRADVTLAPVFGDHAVLQRDRPLLVWGAAARARRWSSRSPTAGRPS